MTYGQRFRLIRKRNWKRGTFPLLMQRFRTPYPATIYNIERLWRTPELPTIGKHAAALGCEPWELLEHVETEYDLARALAVKPVERAREDWGVLVAKYNQSTRRGNKPRDGHALAIPLESHDEADQVSARWRAAVRREATAIERLAGEPGQAHRVDQPARPTRITRQHAATSRVAAPGQRPAAGKHRR